MGRTVRCFGGEVPGSRLAWVWGGTVHPSPPEPPSPLPVSSTRHTSGHGTCRPSQPGPCSQPPPTMRGTPSGSATPRHPRPGTMTVAASSAGLAPTRPCVAPAWTWQAAAGTASVRTPGMRPLEVPGAQPRSQLTHFSLLPGVSRALRTHTRTHTHARTRAQ